MGDLPIEPILVSLSLCTLRRHLEEPSPSLRFLWHKFHLCLFFQLAGPAKRHNGNSKVMRLKKQELHVPGRLHGIVLFIYFPTKLFKVDLQELQEGGGYNSQRKSAGTSRGEEGEFPDKVYRNFEGVEGIIPWEGAISKWVHRIADLIFFTLFS